jgi:hypothetical protein
LSQGTLDRFPNFLAGPIQSQTPGAGPSNRPYA